MAVICVWEEEGWTGGEGGMWDGVICVREEGGMREEGWTGDEGGMWESVQVS